MSEFGVNKLLGSGKITIPLNVTVEAASARAVEKIEAAGGSVTQSEEEWEEESEEILEEVESGRIEPQVARVSIDARKWLAAKMYPKFFSDRVQLQHDVTVDVRKQHIEELRHLSGERQENKPLRFLESSRVVSEMPP